MKIEIEVTNEIASYIEANPYWIFEAFARQKRLLAWAESQKKESDETARFAALPIIADEVWRSLVTPGTNVIRVGCLPEVRKKEAMYLYRKGILKKAKHPYYIKYLYLSRNEQIKNVY